MPIFPTITVCTDFSPGAVAAVERAVQLAVEHGAALRLLQVCAPGPSSDPDRASPAEAIKRPADDATIETHFSKQRQRLDALTSQLAQRTGLHIESVFGIGTAHVVIGDDVQSQPPSLLVLGSRFDPAAAGLGGTALQLLRTPGCPVLLVRRHGAKPYRQVLSGVDLRDGSVRAAVAALALFPGAHHHLLYAVATTLDSSLEAGGLNAAQVQAIHEAMYQHAERELHLLTQGLSTQTRQPVAAEVANDMPARALLVGAASLNADCVVVGHHDASTIGQSELGSMALHVLQFISGDVLVVP